MHNKISVDNWYDYFNGLLFNESADPIDVEINVFSSQNELNVPFTIDEIISSIMRLKSNKSPGPDGIPSEFYKSTMPEITHIHVHLFNKILNSGIFPVSWGLKHDQSNI